MSECANVEIPEYLGLQGASGRRLDDGDELDNVGEYAYHCASADAEEVYARFRAGLHAQAQVCFECGGARRHGHG